MAVDVTTLTGHPFFEHLTSDQRQALSQVLVERQYAAGEVIFEEGAPGRACAFIARGVVHVEVYVVPGQPQRRINTMGVGEIFGEIALIDGGLRTATCLAGDDGATILLLQRDDFGALFDAGNPFAFSLTRLMARQLARRARHAARVWREATVSRE